MEPRFVTPRRSNKPISLLRMASQEGKANLATLPVQLRSSRAVEAEMPRPCVGRSELSSVLGGQEEPQSIMLSATAAVFDILTRLFLSTVITTLFASKLAGNECAEDAVV